MIGHQNFAAAVKKVVEPMGKTSLVLDMVDVQEHDSGWRWNKFLFCSLKRLKSNTGQLSILPDRTQPNFRLILTVLV